MKINRHSRCLYASRQSSFRSEVIAGLDTDGHKDDDCFTYLLYHLIGIHLQLTTYPS